MKESRTIIIISLIIIVLLFPIYIILKRMGISIDLCINIITNLSCGLFVAFITAICQYNISKRNVINTLYNLYFDLYMTCYYVQNRKVLHHYNSFAIYKKLLDVSQKITNSLSEYQGFIKKQDSMYFKMNPQIMLNESHKSKNFIKTMVQFFNEKSFEKTIVPFIEEIERILKNIDEKKYNNDKEQMIEIFKYISD